MRASSVLAALTLLACSQAAAQSLLIPDSNQRVIMEFDAVTGALIDAEAIDLSDLTGGLARTPIEVIEAPNGELWVSDLVADTVFRLSADGATYLGTVGASLDNCRGMAAFGTSVLIANSGTGGGAPGDSLVELDGAGNTASMVSIGDPLDVEPFTFQGVPGFLVSDIAGEDLVFAEAADLGNQSLFHGSIGITSIDTPEQIHVSAGGRVFAAGSSSPVGIYEYNGNGAEVDYIDVSAIAGLGGVRGVYLLGNGNLLFTTGAGVHVYDANSGVITTEISGVSGRFIAYYGGELCPCTTYCSANANSTGQEGAITATGSSAVLDNDFVLTASQLPPASFGFFITGQQQGFVMNPAGSAGNLCLSGPIGRYVGPGQIQNSGAAGSASLALDLTQTPQPNGIVSIVAGETWCFQYWHRDSMGGQVTSNFTQAISTAFQ